MSAVLNVRTSTKRLSTLERNGDMPTLRQLHDRPLLASTRRRDPALSSRSFVFPAKALPLERFGRPLVPIFLIAAFSTHNFFKLRPHGLDLSHMSCTNQRLQIVEHS